MKFSQIIKIPAIAVFTLSLLGAFAQSANAAESATLKPGQVLLTARQESVPQKPSSGDDDSTTQVIAVKLTVRKTGSDSANITIKTEFFGRDVEGGSRVPNASKSKDVELKGNVVTEVMETSDAFVYNPPKKNKKGKKLAPASGTRPLGWTVKVYQGSTLLTATASSPGFLTGSGKD